MIRLRQAFRGAAQMCAVVATVACAAACATVPPDDFFAKPVFRAAAEMRARADDPSAACAFAAEITSNRFPCGVFVLDGDWQTYPGALRFDPAAVADPARLGAQLKADARRWVVSAGPFVSPDSPLFRTFAGAPGAGVWLAEASGAPALLRWESGVSAAWDLTQAHARGLLSDRLLRAAERWGIDGFAFQDVAPALAGAPMAGDYLARYRSVTRFFPYHIFPASGATRAQLVQLPLADGSWEALGATIPAVLAAATNGLPYAAVAPVGAVYTSPVHAVDERLFIRACAVQALLPVMQFGCAPWRVLSAEGTDICREFARLHLKMAPYILSCVRAAAGGPAPVRALADVFPGQGYERVRQQFMLGEKYLVAPVVRLDDTVVVEIPAGAWKDPRGMTVEGPRQLQLTRVPLSFLPYFERH